MWFGDAVSQDNCLENKISNNGKFSILRECPFEASLIHQLLSLSYQLSINLPLNDCFLKFSNLFIYFPRLSEVLLYIIPLGFRYWVFLFIQTYWLIYFCKDIHQCKANSKSIICWFSNPSTKFEYIFRSKRWNTLVICVNINFLVNFGTLRISWLFKIAAILVSWWIWVDSEPSHISELYVCIPYPIHR